VKKVVTWWLQITLYQTDRPTDTFTPLVIMLLYFRRTLLVTAGRLTWAVEVGRLDAISRSAHAEVAIWRVDADMMTTSVVC